MPKTYTLTDKQSALFRKLGSSRWSRYLIDGAARSSKTTVICLRLLSWMAEHPGIRILCLRQHRSHAKVSLWDQTIVPMVEGRSEFTLAESMLELTHSNGSVLRVDGLDTPARADRVLGQEASVIFLNEVVQMQWGPVQTAISRLAQPLPSFPIKKLIMDCNPQSPRHWVHLFAIDHVDPETHAPLDPSIWCRMQFFLQDNPKLERSALDNLMSLTGTARKRFCEGVWCQADNLVYPDWSDANVIDPPTTPPDYKIVGVDSGMSDPMVMVVGSVRPTPDGLRSVHIDRIWQQPGRDMSISVADQAALMGLQDALFVVDPSAGAAIVELRARGFRAEPAHNRIQDGVRIVQDMIAKRRLTCSPDCRVAIESELNAYEMDPDSEKPVQGSADHCFIADTMIAVPGGERRIADIVPGDMVLTSKGPRVVLKSWDNGVREVGLVQFTHGRSLTGTPDHPVIVTNGTCRLDAMRYNDPVTIMDTGGRSCQTVAHTLVTYSAVGLARVYDLTVADCHEYYANGVLVHNCLDGIRYLCSHVGRQAPTRLSLVVLAGSADEQDDDGWPEN